MRQTKLNRLPAAHTTHHGAYTMFLIDLIANTIVFLLDALAAIPALGWAILITTIGWAALRK
jgi:hypothetical protein